MEGLMFQADVLKEITKDSDIKKDEPMSLHTTFRIGGKADMYIETGSTTDFINIIRYLQKEQCNYFVMGNGSNLLVNDKGYRGVIVSTRRKKNLNVNSSIMDNVHIVQETDNLSQAGNLDDVYIYYADNHNAAAFFAENGYTASVEALENKNLVNAGSGILLSNLAGVVAEAGLTGFEFASGIPGTLGGAAAMNAGAYGGEMKDVIEGARVLAEDGSIKVLKKEELELSYRSSIIQKEKMIVLDVLFAFEKGDKEQILAQMKELNQRRREKQPLEYGSAGSTFKRPEGYFAGKLIQDSGLRGYRCGDVMVSEKHSGFVVNVGNGTFEQAMDVINHVKEEVKKHFGVSLEVAVKIL